jgi:hypothetical protein
MQIERLLPIYSCLNCAKDSKKKALLLESKIMICVNCLRTEEGMELNQQLEEEYFSNNEKRK